MLMIWCRNGHITFESHVNNPIGVGCAALEVLRGVAVPLELRQHIALGVIGILLDPAVGIGQLDGTVGIIV